MDPTLVLQNEEEAQVQKVINIALLCIQTAAERRPTMAQAVAMLQGDMEVGIAEHQSNRKLQNAFENIFDFGTSSTNISTDTNETGSLIIKSLELSRR